jgi:hypothetical protein
MILRSKKSYIIGSDYRTTINPMFVNPGDKFTQQKNEDGSILLIPEKK